MAIMEESSTDVPLAGTNTLILDLLFDPGWDLGVVSLGDVLKEGDLERFLTVASWSSGIFVFLLDPDPGVVFVLRGVEVGVRTAGDLG
jgi:hypothetical protein